MMDINLGSDRDIIALKKSSKHGLKKSKFYKMTDFFIMNVMRGKSVQLKQVKKYTFYITSESKRINIQRIKNKCTNFL